MTEDILGFESRDAYHINVLQVTWKYSIQWVKANVKVKVTFR